MPEELAGLFHLEGKVMTTASATDKQLLTRDEVLSLLKCSRSTIYVMMDCQGFPKPIKFGAANRWFKTEVDAWLEQQPRAQIQVREPVPLQPAVCVTTPSRAENAELT